MWCIPTIDPEFIKRMYDVLDLYEEDYDPKRPIVCLDEKPKQLLRACLKIQLYLTIGIGLYI